MAVIRELVPIVRTVITFAPWLVDVPVLGAILLSLSDGDGGNELQALEKLAAEILRKKLERDERIARNGRYVLKASEAMQCVEDNLMQANILLILGKALIDTVVGRPNASFADVVTERIFTCIESKVLKQTGKRGKKTKKWYGRPAKGHGHGR